MIRYYKPEDKTAVLNLLKLNIPKYFADSEFEDFIEYLDAQLEDYFVLEENDVIIGAGGINYFPANRMARISWDFMHPNSQGKGIGSRLLGHRVDLLKKNPNIDSVGVRTSQHAHGFYAKAGFSLDRTEKDYWEKGFDLYEMKLPF